MDPVSFGRLWPETVAAVRRHTELLWPVAAAFFFLPQLLASRQIDGRLPNQWFQEGERAGDSMAIALVLLSSIAGQLLVSRIIIADGTAGRTLGYHLQRSMALVIPGFAVWLIRGIGVVTGFWLLVIPGLWLFVRLLLVVPLVAIGTSDPMEALRQSWELTRGRGFRLFGMMTLLITGYLLLILGIGGIGAAVGVITAVAAGVPEQGWGIGRWLVEMIGAGAAAAFDTFYAAFIAMILMALRDNPKAAD